jgi:hypothetical protein
VKFVRSGNGVVKVENPARTSDYGTAAGDRGGYRDRLGVAALVWRREKAKGVADE